MSGGFLWRLIGLLDSMELHGQRKDLPNPGLRTRQIASPTRICSVERWNIQGVYERHLLRTLAVNKGPAVLRVLPGKTVGE